MLPQFIPILGIATSDRRAVCSSQSDLSHHNRQRGRIIGNSGKISLRPKGALGILFLNGTCDILHRTRDLTAGKGSPPQVIPSSFSRRRRDYWCYPDDTLPRGALRAASPCSHFPFVPCLAMRRVGSVSSRVRGGRRRVKECPSFGGGGSIGDDPSSPRVVGRTGARFVATRLFLTHLLKGSNR